MHYSIGIRVIVVVMAAIELVVISDPAFSAPVPDDPASEN
jgi:hypothetical protein